MVDGYIENAKVCLDKNRNTKCDADEPFAMTDATGKYAFDQVIDDQENYPIIAEVTADSKDKDDKGAKVAKPYTLSTPAGKQAVISPLTTLAKAEMDIDPTLDPTDAEQNILAKLDMHDGKDYTASAFDDYIPNKKATDANTKKDAELLHKVAKELVKQTTQFQEALKAANIDDTDLTAINQVVMQTASNRLEDLKKTADDAEFGQANYDLGVTASKDSLKFAKEKVQRSSKAQGSSFNDIFLSGKKVVEFTFRLDLTKSKVKIYEMKSNLEKKLEDDELAEKTTIAKYTLPKSGYNIKTVFETMAAEGNKAKTVDLKGQTILMNDLVRARYGTASLKDVSVTFGEGDIQYVWNYQRKAFGQIAYPNDKDCPAKDEPFRSSSRNCGTKSKKDYLDQTTIADYIKAADESYAKNRGENDYKEYFKNPKADGSGGEQWVYHHDTKKSYYLRDYEIKTKDGKDYLIYGRYTRPFNNLVVTYDADYDDNKP